MRIKGIRHKTIRLRGNIANSLVNFSEHTVSLVAVISDVERGGLPLAGVAFNSIGRYGQAGIIAERLVPRLLAAAPDSLLDMAGASFDCGKVAACALRNEKPGGHGDRAAALGAVELAFWDLNAKLCDEPAYVAIARAFGGDPARHGIPAYAAGGYYYPQDGLDRLRAELRGYQGDGFSAFKIKIGGASLTEDVARIEAALAIAGSGARGRRQWALRTCRGAGLCRGDQALWVEMV
jgi:L-alanine-DL-glutamate epimerase-like enolase superfamily enzyme